MENNSLEPLWKKFSEEKFEEVIQEAKIIIDKNDPSNQNEALKLLGLSYFRLAKYDLAEKAFVEQTKKSVNPDDWFNVVTTSTLNKNIELSEKALAKTIECYQKNGTQENIPIPQIYYYYMQALRDVKEYKKAFSIFQKLKDIYCKAVITDSHFLYTRGVPMFEHAMSAGKAILENIDKGLAKKFLNELWSHVDDEGKEYLREYETTLKSS